MSKTVWTDRSRIETYQRCARLRFLSYHQDSRGIAPAKLSLPLAVGLAVHVGLETLLRAAMMPNPALASYSHEDAAVAAALADFSTHRSALALDLQESAALATVLDIKDAGFAAQLTATAAELGMTPDDPALGELLTRQRNSAAEFDQWLFNEQAALVEAMVRAYARRRLRPLLEEFEVLEVEREGDWELASWLGRMSVLGHGDNPNSQMVTLRFMSRPDALLRSRTDNSLYILSYKTAATWDVRKARDAEHDMQGLSEGVEVERRLGEWWAALQACQSKEIPPSLGKAIYDDKNTSPKVLDFLRSLPAPPRILGIRYEYLLKGYRGEDKELTRRFGLRVWSQRSLLIRRYVSHSTPSRGKNAGGFSIGDAAWSWDYHLEDGTTSKLSASNWHSESVWDGPNATTVKAWIDTLDATAETMSAYDSTTGAEPRSLGFGGAAQAIGFTVSHPLDDVFPAPLTIYRQDDQLRDFVDQIEAQETRIAEAVAQVEASDDEGERRHLLNVHFPMSRRACEYPSSCAMIAICFGGEDIRRDPLSSDKYRQRTPNHQQEKDAVVAGEE